MVAARGHSWPPLSEHLCIPRLTRAFSPSADTRPKMSSVAARRMGTASQDQDMRACVVLYSAQLGVLALSCWTPCELCARPQRTAEAAAAHSTWALLVEVDWHIDASSKTSRVSLSLPTRGHAAATRVGVPPARAAGPARGDADARPTWKTPDLRVRPTGSASGGPEQPRYGQLAAWPVVPSLTPPLFYEYYFLPSCPSLSLWSAFERVWVLALSVTGSVRLSGLREGLTRGLLVMERLTVRGYRVKRAPALAGAG